LRLRQEVAKLIIKHCSQGSDNLAKIKEQVKIYGILLQGLSVSSSSVSLREHFDSTMLQKATHHTAHLKLQQEIAHWAYLEEEAKRKIVSAGQTRPGR
jgi:hypothetical protein